jgi:hypothetical protein
MLLNICLFFAVFVLFVVNYFHYHEEHEDYFLNYNGFLARASIFWAIHFRVESGNRLADVIEHLPQSYAIVTIGHKSVPHVEGLHHGNTG